MRLTWEPRLQLSFVAAGVGIAGIGVGLFQSLHGASQARKAQKALLNQQTPTTPQNKAINDYYQMALNKHNAGIFNSAGYGAAKAGNEQALGAGLAAAQSGKQGVQQAGALVQQYSNNNNKAVANAEAEDNRAFTQLGQATGAKAADDKYTFGINSMLPYNKNRDVYMAQAAGGNAIENAGLENIGSGVNNAASIYSANKYAGIYNKKPR